MKQVEVGRKDDHGKPRWELLLWREISQIVDVLTYGAERYQRDNWQHVEPFRDRYTGAVMRHITAWIMGKQNDNESGLPHLAHACCCLLFLMWKDNQRSAKSER